MARALTSDELVSLRSDQASILWLDVDVPPVVFACQVNQTFATLDKVIEVAYDTVTAGAYGDVLPGMTVLVGSAAGLADIGICRNRKSATSTKLFLGEHADIAWANNIHITVLDDFGIWDREKRTLADGTQYMDSEIAYSDQHTAFYPIVNAGPARRVAKLSGSYVDLQFNLTGSWVLGSTLSTYSVSAPGSVSVTGGTTATPTIRYNAAGRYRVAFTVTAANGKSTTVYRTVRVWSNASPLISAFTLDACRGSYDNGGWEFSVAIQGADANIRERAMITVVSQDFYDGDEVSIGPIVGYENIVAIGWVSNEPIEYDPNGGKTKFEVKGPHWWMNQLTGSDVALVNVGTTPAKWSEMFGLTIDKAIYHLVYWRSTIAFIMDVYKSGDPRLAPELTEPISSLWQKLANFADKILARPCCDRYGRLFVEIDPQLTEVADRSDVIVMTLQKGDWLDNGLDIKRRYVSSDARIDLTTWLVEGGSEPKTLYSLAPGHNFKRWGQNIPLDNYLAASQAQSNAMAGLILGANNHVFDFDFSLAMNNRMVDIVPAQYVEVDIAEGDTSRGIAYSGNVVVREVELLQDNRGFLLTDWSAEQESVPENSTNGDIPDGEGGFDDPPDVPPLDFSMPSLPSIPMPPTTDPLSVKTVVLMIKDKGVFYTKDFDAKSPHWFAMNSGLPSFANLVNLEISASGKLFLQIGGSAIYYAPSLGSAWQSIFDTTLIGNPQGYAFPRDPEIMGFGINRNGDDDIIIIAGLVVTIFSTCIVYPWRGSHSSLSQTSGTYILIPSAASRRGFLNLKGDKWLWSFVNTSEQVSAATLSKNGAVVVDVTAMPGGGYPILAQSRFATDAATVLATKPRLTLNGGASWSELTSAPTPFGSFGDLFQSVAPNSDGQKIVIGVNDVIGFRRSSDFGATWGMTSIAQVVTSVWHVGKDSWIFAGANQIKITHDMGDTVEQKTGDLQSWVTAFFNVLAIRHLP
jgi:hypothetical protein